MRSRDLLSLTIRQYNECMFGWRKLGPCRYAIDVGYISLIVEFWWLRDWKDANRFNVN